MKFTIVGSELYRVGVDGVLRRCVPIFARNMVITNSHLGGVGGHFVAKTTSRKILALLQAYGGQHYTKMSRHFVNIVNCQRIGRPTTMGMALLISIPPLQPFMKCGLDFM